MASTPLAAEAGDSCNQQDDAGAAGFTETKPASGSTRGYNQTEPDYELVFLLHSAYFVSAPPSSITINHVVSVSLLFFSYAVLYNITSMAFLTLSLPQK